MTSGGLRIDLEAQPLDAGTPYEKAAFGLIEMTSGGKALTACVSTDSDRPPVPCGPVRLRLPPGGVAGLELVASALGTASARRPLSAELEHGSLHGGHWRGIRVARYHVCF